MVGAWAALRDGFEHFTRSAGVRRGGVGYWVRNGTGGSERGVAEKCVEEET